MADLLIELFSEEIPARMQAKAAADLKRLMTDGLVEAGLTYEGAAAHATPRRLALTVQGLTDRSPDTSEERRGPKAHAPEKAIEGFLRGAGVSRDDLEAREEKKGTFLYATIRRAGRAAEEIVAEVLERTVRDFPWPKSMRWGDGTLRWVRPLRRILCLMTREDGASVVPVEVDGIVASDVTEGHRFMSPAPFAVTSWDDYATKLKRAHVVLEAEERAEIVRAGMDNLCFAAGLSVVPDDGLMAEVAGLVEWPVPLMGRIDDAFLGLPPEVLRTSMKEHQKFFSVADRDGKIVRFVTVANRETADGGATILDGNQRVLAARLADAVFFWENDLSVARAGMGAWLDKLSDVTFHAKLGSQRERIDRIAALAREIAPSVGADPDQAERAARLAKADLASEMVYEFPELQGVMGRYYALEAGEPEAVANAARDHYAPLGPSDDVPTEPVSVAAALADKIDLLTGMWAIDEKPTGSKDPFALRRAALGVIRICLTQGVSLWIADPITYAASKHLEHAHSGPAGVLKAANDILYALAENDHWGESDEQRLTLRKRLSSVVPLLPFRRYLGASKVRDDDVSAIHRLSLVAWYASFEEAEREARVSQDFDEDQKEHEFRMDYSSVLGRDGSFAKDLLSFLHDRLKVHLRDEGVRHDVIDAVLTGGRTDDLADVTARARALNAFLATDNGENLIQGYRRAKNILEQAEAKDGVEYSFGADPKLAETDEERALFDALGAAKPGIDAAMEAEDYAGAMERLADLRAPIDAFFEAVQVNAENDIVRRNRLNLLHAIREAPTRIADLSRLEG